MGRRADEGQALGDCKIKRVHARPCAPCPLRASTASYDEMHAVYAGWQRRAVAMAKKTSDWDVKRLRKRLRKEISLVAWKRLQAAAKKAGMDVDGLLRAHLEVKE